jgi:hypothetical protein
MPNAEDIRWFKQNFQQKIEAAVQGTPFTLDLLTAVACQETGEVWPILRKQSLSLNRILELCVGDTLDDDRGRSAFPRNKAELVTYPHRGQEMFDLARQALVDMAHYVASYRGAASKPHKFCRGFGIFQYDLQFFLEDPDYFLHKRYADFDTCLHKCLAELKDAQRGIGYQHKTTLTEHEMTYVAIAYNIGPGRFRESKGLQQGYKPIGGKHYGEQLYDFLLLSNTVHLASPLPNPVPPHGGTSPTGTVGSLYRVEVQVNPLRLRREPSIDENNPTSNVIARLPNGLIVRAISDNPINGFLEVEAEISGIRYRGFASAIHLKPA